MTFIIPFPRVALGKEGGHTLGPHGQKRSVICPSECLVWVYNSCNGAREQWPLNRSSKTSQHHKQPKDSFIESQGPSQTSIKPSEYNRRQTQIPVRKGVQIPPLTMWLEDSIALLEKPQRVNARSQEKWTQ